MTRESPETRLGPHLPHGTVDASDRLTTRASRQEPPNSTQELDKLSPPVIIHLGQIIYKGR